jgi:hypothetical protein
MIDLGLNSDAAPRLGEFHRIGQQVDQNLFDDSFVSPQFRQIG